ncbi:MAG: phosphopyruvate hydratase [Candidatus Zambryskibacteria bacterium RIFOXYC1_FULL_39_10]|uniref:Enolase n=1 Tax=Candidatus Zambryskibacteria bacterium RIFOXYC1_FULL_39_10 TaxID=1802779 RepID=A0A1G2V2M1_9BACT|nr:MAG: phosphopyruvate hydratase [Candidatus Zambryskibacteria bacterium RIFOXYD1_FULL_39_35]OHB15872.1 MAG: phosphopyruvate hydratase [Candidatus Zambryskibacteria bacterium RIFOXYC1_FULL_39_10]
MYKIEKVLAREILDSRGNPTVEADVILEGGHTGTAAVPSGASTGSNEALELRDGDMERYGGKGVLKAVLNVNTKIADVLIGMDASNQNEIDARMIELDGTENKGNLGANAILAVSLATAKAVAGAKNIPLFEHIRSFAKNPKEISLPIPLCNIINGGRHASGSSDIQEFMIAPIGAKSFGEAMQILHDIFNSLRLVVESKGYETNLGDEGGFAPHLKGGNREALELISEAIGKTNYKPGSDIYFALDVAASEFYDDTTQKYKFATENKEFNSDELIEYYKNLIKEFPIFSIEDGLAEDDWDGWDKMTSELQGLQLVGDDLLVTNIKFLEKAIAKGAGNAILIKPNQIGTLSETISAVDLAHSVGWNTIISHRSGETMDSTIAHIAVGLGTGQIKTGSVSKPERMAKYDELLQIEKMLGEKATYAGHLFN